MVEPLEISTEKFYCYVIELIFLNWNEERVELSDTENNFFINDNLEKQGRRKRTNQLN